MIGIICAGIKVVMGVSLIGAGYYTAKAIVTEEKEEIIKTENILKYEYFPTEKVNTDKKVNVIKYTFVYFHQTCYCQSKNSDYAQPILNIVRHISSPTLQRRFL